MRSWMRCGLMPAVMLAALGTAGCGAPSRPSPGVGAGPETSIYLGPDGEALIPVLPPSGERAAMEACAPWTLRRIDQIDVIGICVGGLAPWLTKDERAAICDAK